MTTFPSIFTAVLIAVAASACSSQSEAAGSIAHVMCRAQAIGTRFHTDTPTPSGIEIWKPTGETVSIGFTAHGNRRTACTVTLGAGAIVTKVDMHHET